MQRAIKYKKTLSLGLLSFLVLVSVGFVTAKNFQPHTSELNFKEYSVLGKQAGSMIPASCVSGVAYPHPYEVNMDRTVDSGCQPICTAPQIMTTTPMYRCFYDVSVLPCWDCSVVNYYYYTAWQATPPSSCPAGYYTATDGTSGISFPAGFVQQKSVYSCTTPASVNLNFN